MTFTQGEISFVDTSVRDGNQSLWDATGLKAGMILAIAPEMDKVGFKAIDFTTGTTMAVSVRFHKENPWDLIRLTAKAMPRTPLSFGGTGRRFMGWTRIPEPVMALAMNLVIKAGIRRVWFLEPSFDTALIASQAMMSKAAGAQEVVVALAYTISPVHTDEYYAKKTAEIVASPDVDRLYIKDPGGLLTVDRIRTLLPAIQKTAAGKPIEIHSHCNTGLAPLVYLEAVRMGVRTVHTAISPLANGTSQPSAENTLKNLRRLGYSANLSEEALTAMAAHFRKVAERQNRPLGMPVEYDVYYYEHQVPGGMLTTLKRHLAEIKMGHRLDEILEEIIKVRKELGYPIMVTPYSQFIGSQATTNVLSGKRYAQVPNQLVEYVAGYYGAPPMPIDQEVLDKITSLPQAKNILNANAHEPTLEELRQKVGVNYSDEEFLMRLALPAKEVDNMQAAGPINTFFR